MDEGYRSTARPVRRTFQAASILYERSYAAFNNERRGRGNSSMRLEENVLWGSDDPHFEGTFGHTQTTMHEQFDGVDAASDTASASGAIPRTVPSTCTTLRGPQPINIAMAKHQTNADRSGLRVSRSVHSPGGKRRRETRPSPTSATKW